MSVHGPHEPRSRSDQSNTDRGYVTCHLVNAPFSGNERKKRKLGDRRGNEIEIIVKETFESIILLDLYQRSQITIVVHVFEADGSIICSMLNAATLALMDAGINMRDMIASCSVGVHKQLIHRDLTQIEQTSGYAYLPVAILCQTKQIVYIQMDSRMAVDLLESAIDEAVRGCLSIRKVLEDIFFSHMLEVITS